MEEVAPLEPLAAHGGGEHEGVVPSVGVADLADVGEVLEDAQHAAQDRAGDRLAGVGLERDGAGEHDVLGEQIDHGLGVAVLDRLAERVHGRSPVPSHRIE